MLITKIKSFLISNTNIITSIFIVFIIKFLLSYFPSFSSDMGTWFGWADRLKSLGFTQFYSDIVWTQYTPGYMYWLWLIGHFGWLNEFAIKIPVVITEIATGVLIWSLIKQVNVKLALPFFFLYTLNPVVIFDGSVWGQIDGLLTFFLFVSAYFLIEKKNFVLSVLFWSIAFSIKPQSIAVAPIFLLVIILKKFKLKEIILGAFTGLATTFLLSWPFFLQDPIMGLPRLIIKMGQHYSYTSVNAFNIWAWVGMWRADSIEFLGISFSLWGVILLGSSIILALFKFRNKIDTKANYYLLFAILSLCFFVFPTKVHERYLFPFFAFLLTSAGLSRSPYLFAIYLITTLASFANLYYPYSYYNDNFLRSEFWQEFTHSLANIIGFIFLSAYFILLFWEKLPKFNISNFIDLNKKSVPDKLPKLVLTKKTTNLILGAILAFAFITRIYQLGSPPKEYFDEVYHAFTARTMLHNDTKAWEWWNTPPEGFAYEWTHPPLAKLGMVLGMLIFGENSFGWRVPGALLGVGSVFLVYLLAKEIFKDEGVGLLSSFVFSLDGLPLVLSRIGMNDSYLLFFILSSIYCFLKQKNFLSALFFGLALASKWSALWAIPIFFILWLRRKNKFNVSTFLAFGILPICIYLLSYTQFFLSGHTFKQFYNFDAFKCIGVADCTYEYGLQQQMWAYHTGLDATHPYTSLWSTWPFLLRPIYLYTSDEVEGMVSRIYAMGNPLVFWFGFTSIVLSLIYAYIEKNRKLGLVVFSYLIFFVPWAASPRIMFLYHYLPSLPFLAIAVGYTLRRTPKLMIPVLGLMLLSFIYFYPHWAGLQVPLWLDKSYYWIPSWR